MPNTNCDYDCDLARDEEAFPDLKYSSPFMVWAFEQRIEHGRHVSCADYDREVLGKD